MRLDRRAAESKTAVKQKKGEQQRKVKAELIELIQLIELNKLISCRSDFKGRAAMPHPDWSLSIQFV